MLKMSIPEPKQGWGKGQVKGMIKRANFRLFHRPFNMWRNRTISIKS